MYARGQIIAHIQRLTAENFGNPPGRRTFERETGIRYTDWYGRYWARWGDALIEAGFSPNERNTRIADDDLLKRFAELARELGRIPAFGDLLLRRRTDMTLPDEKVFRTHFGRKSELVVRLRQWCEANPGFEDVLALCPVTSTSTQQQAEEPPQSREKPVVGYVYLIRSGRHYKIGRTNSVGRRERELAIQLPQEARTVHAIETDDPVGIEAYWHKRFADKRANGEWFALEPEDVRAFRRRRFQ